MTQEELDALMSGEIEDLDSFADDEIDGDLKMDSAEFEDGTEDLNLMEESDYNLSGDIPRNSHHWAPPAINENKMVHQLDDVTKESEEKASEIFDIIEGISNNMFEDEHRSAEVIKVLKSNIELFRTLKTKFPDVEAFKTQLNKNSLALGSINDIVETLGTSQESIIKVMDIMQYQDIHRQKIERVINVMRALSGYMNSLFEGKVEDKKRVSSAQHIVGDERDGVVSNEDIEALLAQFGK